MGLPPETVSIRPGSLGSVCRGRSDGASCGMRQRSRIISSRRTFGSASFRAAGKLIGHPHLFVSKLKARGLLLETGVDPTRLRAPRANQRRVTGRDEDRGPRAQRNSRYAVLRFAHVSGAPEYLKFLLFKNYYFTNNISPHGTSSNATTAVRYNYLHAHTHTSPRLS